MRALVALAAILAAPAAAGAPLAADVAPDSGLAFRHALHTFEPAWFQDLTSGGLCWGDYDRDGAIDLYATDTWGTGGEGRSRLFRNVGGGRFADATDASGAGLVGVANGCVFADYDNDGWPDLLVTFAVTGWSSRGTTLLRNLEGRGFLDVTAASGISGDSPGPEEGRCQAGAALPDGSFRGHCWSIGAAWLDYDLDGDLDLFLANYAEVNVGTCPELRPVGPQFCRGQRDRLWSNEGDGTFAEVGAAAGVASNADPTLGRGMGVVAGDLDGDAWPDLYVANDQDSNSLFLNRRDGTFLDAARARGADNAGNTFIPDSRHRAGMGVDAADFDGDGDVDLLSTHLQRQFDAIYLADGDAYGEVANAIAALREIAFAESRWGGGLVDLDLDGRRDYLVAAGHQLNLVAGPIHLALARDAGLELQRAPEWPFGLDSPETWRNYRGLAFADYDNDGDMDAAVEAIDSSGGPRDAAGRRAPPALRLLGFAARETTGNGFLRVELTGTDGARDAVGAKVEVVTDDGRTLWGWRTSGGSYASGHDPRLLFGLGHAGGGTVRVTWPGGHVQGPVAFEANSTLRIAEPDLRAPSAVELRGAPRLEEGGARVAWRGTFATDFAAYRVRVESADGQAGLTEIAQRALTDALVALPGQGPWTIRVTVVDAGGHESAAASPGRLEAPAVPAPGAAWAAGAVAAAAWAARGLRRAQR